MSSIQKSNGWLATRAVKSGGITSLALKGMRGRHSGWTSRVQSMLYSAQLAVSVIAVSCPLKQSAATMQVPPSAGGSCWRICVANVKVPGPFARNLIPFDLATHDPLGSKLRSSPAPHVVKPLPLTCAALPLPSGLISAANVVAGVIVPPLVSLLIFHCPHLLMSSRLSI